MSVSLIKLGTTYTSSGHKEFIMDSVSDVANLDGLDKCAPGSFATVIGGDRYILTPSGKWVIHNDTASYDDSELRELISSVPKFDIKVVDELPTSDIDTGTIYLVRSEASTEDVYKEYIYTSDSWEVLGTQKDVNETLDTKLDKDNPVATGSFSLGRLADTTVGENSTASGYDVTASANYSHAEGSSTVAGALNAHVEGRMTQVGNYTAHQTTAASTSTVAGFCGHAEGYDTIASGAESHAEGNYTIASGKNSHAEGLSNTSSGQNSHSEGYNNVSSGVSAHAEGNANKASGTSSHVEGYYNTSSANYAHAEGSTNTASGDASHAEGYYNTTSASYSHVQGKFAINNTSYAHVVGNGSGSSSRSDAHTLDWNGNAWFAGDVYVGSTGGKIKDSGSKKLLALPNSTSSGTIFIYDGDKWCEQDGYGYFKTETSLSNQMQFVSGTAQVEYSGGLIFGISEVEEEDDTSSSTSVYDMVDKLFNNDTLSFYMNGVSYTDITCSKSGIAYTTAAVFAPQNYVKTWSFGSYKVTLTVQYSTFGSGFAMMSGNVPCTVALTNITENSDDYVIADITETTTLATIDEKYIPSTFVKTTDSRLSDARTPTAHTHTTSDISDLSTQLPSISMVDGDDTYTIASLLDRLKTLETWKADIEDGETATY